MSPLRSKFEKLVKIPTAQPQSPSGAMEAAEQHGLLIKQQMQIKKNTALIQLAESNFNKTLQIESSKRNQIRFGKVPIVPHSLCKTPNFNNSPRNVQIDQNLTFQNPFDKNNEQL